MTSNKNISFIPELGTELVLQKDWECTIFFESRNEKLIKTDGYIINNHRDFYGDKKYKRTFPSGSKFIVRRIYVRNGAKDFSSITLSVLETAEKKYKNIRFWVKLADYNNASFCILKDVSISVEPKKIVGSPITISKLKKRKYLNCYIVFNHPDPDLSFENEISLKKPEECMLYFRSPQKISLGYSERVVKNNNLGFFSQYSNQNFYYYTPNSLTNSLIPSSWYDKKITKYAIEPQHVEHPLDLEAIIRSHVRFAHPLDNELRISGDIEKREKMGLGKNKSEIVDINISGGVLSLYEIELK